MKEVIIIVGNIASGKSTDVENGLYLLLRLPIFEIRCYTHPDRNDYGWNKLISARSLQ